MWYAARVTSERTGQKDRTMKLRGSWEGQRRRGVVVRCVVSVSGEAAFGRRVSKQSGENPADRQAVVKSERSGQVWV